MRLQTGTEVAHRDYAFDVKPRWPLQTTVAGSGAA